MRLVMYIVDEVVRQGHDVTQRDGIERIGWMINAWMSASGWTPRDITPQTIARLGTLVEPKKNRGGLRRCGMTVGGIACPAYKEVPALLENLCARISLMDHWEFYREFETIHPFADGNGRTGKILLNVLTNSMLSPIRPPETFWGRPIRNP